MPVTYPYPIIPASYTTPSILSAMRPGKIIQAQEDMLALAEAEHYVWAHRVKTWFVDRLTEDVSDPTWDQVVSDLIITPSSFIPRLVFGSLGDNIDIRLTIDDGTTSRQYVNTHPSGGRTWLTSVVAVNAGDDYTCTIEANGTSAEYYTSAIWEDDLARGDL